MKYRILHLSDIHIGKAFKDVEEVSCNICGTLSSYGHRPDKIVVTGDIFDHSPQQVVKTGVLPGITAAVSVPSVDSMPDNEKIEKYHSLPSVHYSEKKLAYLLIRALKEKRYLKDRTEVYDEDSNIG